MDLEKIRAPECNRREWQHLSTTVDLQSVKYDCCDESYPDMTFTFQLQRSSPAYRALMVLPCLGKYISPCITCNSYAPRNLCENTFC